MWHAFEFNPDIIIIDVCWLVWLNCAVINITPPWQCVTAITPPITLDYSIFRKRLPGAVKLYILSPSVKMMQWQYYMCYIRVAGRTSSYPQQTHYSYQSAHRCRKPLQIFRFFYLKHIFRGGTKREKVSDVVSLAVMKSVFVSMCSLCFQGDAF